MYFIVSVLWSRISRELDSRNGWRIKQAILRWLCAGRAGAAGESRLRGLEELQPCALTRCTSGHSGGHWRSRHPWQRIPPDRPPIAGPQSYEGGGSAVCEDAA